GSVTSSCPVLGGCSFPAPDGYSPTPGAILCCTTSGCTHIIYVRKFLLECKNSPVARNLPCCLPQIPGVTSLARCSLVKPGELKEQNESEEAMPDQDQCEMDI
uniref:Eukaryotic translation initiation factor 4E binding protein 3 n=1 Tax=Anas zonorhyncha TaxID=75864 RepID=A0A8B9VAI3_9AVES